MKDLMRYQSLSKDVIFSPLEVIKALLMGYRNGYRSKGKDSQINEGRELRGNLPSITNLESKIFQS
jgi:hypothetical protein